MNSGRNMMQMQQEAAERVKRMQERSRRLAQEHPVNVYRGTTAMPPDRETESLRATGRLVKPLDEPKQPTCEAAVPLTDSSPDTGMGLSSLLRGDREQTLVLLLAVILAKNGAPLELVLALLYVGM